MSETRARPSLGDLRRAARDVARELGAQLVVLFGSAAREDALRAEDLDLAVLAREPLDPVAVTNAFIERLGVQEVDVADLRRADPVLLALVARDGIALFEETPSEFARFASLAFRRYADTRKFRALERHHVREFAGLEELETEP